jgi:hypothetical protein
VKQPSRLSEVPYLSILPCRVAAPTARSPGGVLDRLLEEPWLEIDGISGTSAGAMNAAVLVEGFAKGGAVGARAALETF